ncbi:MAG: phosphatidylglycerol lysyltransferase domain-containing protein, partial [Candidatus Aureabacteria bacterium]|nr:phosphatidylglycerol lysyltransferase domain-containing protein [Candidatus Auribacterota bacterium]
GSFACEREAIARAFRYFRELNLEGTVLLAGEKLLAFAIHDRLNRTTAVVHFEKSDPKVKGAAQAINRETARRLRGRYELINREQDMGIAGLRQAKRSYDPETIVTPYMLIRRGE